MPQTSPMKPILTFSLAFSLILAGLSASCQEKDSTANAGKPQKNSREYFLKKSENKKITGQILLVGGTALTIGGVFVAAHKTDNFWIQLGNLLLGGTLIGAGITSGLISIPFFISSSKFKKRAAAVTITNIPLQQPELMNGCSGMLPSVTVGISF